jgi:hypothetical protein
MEPPILIELARPLTASSNANYEHFQGVAPGLARLRTTPPMSVDVKFWSGNLKGRHHSGG